MLYSKRLFHHTLALLLFTPGLSAAGNCEIKNSKAGAALIELFTSEGCSSCPPAEAWQNNLKQHKKLWSNVVPVSFHVDYWDYIGWQDKLAHKDHARRQRAYQVKGHARAVYTPGFFINGREWRGFFGLRNFVAKNPKAQGNLLVSVKANQLNVRYDNKNLSNKPVTLHITLLGFDIAHKVSSGENSGRTLKHDFVVLHHIKLKSNGKYQWDIPIKTAALFRGYKPKAIAAWVNTDQDPRPIQVAGGWINKCNIASTL